MKLRYRYEELFPQEFEEVMKVCPIVYLPIGPLEWHAEQLAFGCDALRASEVCRIAWRRTGGVLMPPLFLGTDQFVTERGRELWGMEMFAKQPLPGSLYIPEETLRRVLQEMLGALRKQGFRICALCTGHEAKNQRSVVRDMGNVFGSGSMHVVPWYASMADMPEELRIGGAHAGGSETCELMAIGGKLVRFDRAGRKARDKSVGLSRAAFRGVSPELGRKRLNLEGRQLAARVAAEASW